MMLKWQTTPSDNLLLCQFMVSYELRQGEYITAKDAQENIIAAGVLFEQTDGQAQVDVVVAPAYRRQGVGSDLVLRLIDQAQDRKLNRLTAHSIAPFWLSLGFVTVSDNLFSRLLDNAANELVDMWHDGIPMTKFMGLTITSYSPEHVTTSASMRSCINVHQSMFAGAIYSQAVLTGWGLLHLAMVRYGLQGSIVLASGEVKYRRPLLNDPCGCVQHSLSIDDFATLAEGKKCSIELSVSMSEGESDQASATFLGRYVIIPS